MRRITDALTKVSMIALAAVAVSGCGVEEMQKMKVQSDLEECARLASIGKVEQAKEWAQRAINADPGEVRTFVFTGKSTDPPQLTLDAVFASVGDYKDVEYFDQKAAQKFPNEYHVWASLMNAQDVLGETAVKKQTAQNLVNVLEARIAKGDVDANVLANLADGYWVLGNRAKALTAVQKATSIYVTDWNMYNHVAYGIAVANSKPDLGQALNFANTAMAKAQKQNAEDESVAAIQDTIGWIEYQQGNYKQAEVDINNALEVIPRESESHYHLGMIRLAEGDKPAAKAELTKAVLICPDYADAKVALAQLKDAPDLPPVQSEPALHDPGAPQA